MRELTLDLCSIKGAICVDIPKYYEFMNPMLKALHELGGSGNIDEINDKVIEIMELPEEITSILHKDGPGTEVEYRLAWTRTYLKKYGLINNSSRGVWVLEKTQDSPCKVDPKEVVKAVLDKDKDKNEIEAGEDGDEEDDINADGDEEGLEVPTWKDKLNQVLLEISPKQFESLTKRLLRESGFLKVEVTGGSGDRGIDGKGIIRVGGVLSFHVMFQCKRYSDTVSVSHIRDFRGALQGRADKGLFITTGTFTQEAKREASRDGASPIDLIDGEELMEKLKSMRLGVGVEMVEKVSIDRAWFERL